MERYESKQAQLNKPAGFVYINLSDFSRFTPILADKVDHWQATEDTCSFMVQGFNVALRIVERVENKLIKIEAEQGSPMDFTVWIQLMEVGATDTRMRIVLEVSLNMMMKMMLGKKIQSGLDQAVDKIAEAFNTFPG